MGDEDPDARIDALYTLPIGEFVAATKGLGYLLSFAQSTYNAALMLALVLVIMVFVLLIFAISEWLEKRLTRWRG